LPTRAGGGAAALLFVMLLAGMNYENSLALLLCFILTGLALVSMHECHRTLAGVKVMQAHGESTFAGSEGYLLLSFANGDTRPRMALQSSYRSGAASQFTLEPGDFTTVRVLYRAEHRGLQRIERLKVWTDTPLGLFRAWSWLYLPLDVLVYPAPAGMRHLPHAPSRARDRAQRWAQAGEEEWAWLRPYQESDSPRGVAWKAYARGAPLMVAQYHAPLSEELLLDFDALRDEPTEERLSQLTQWVLECEHRQAHYALRLPSCMLPAGFGTAHRRACLEALALYAA
jgi:uncharacterized protein (DUF58 family)